MLILAGILMAAARVAFKRNTVIESSYTYSIRATKRFNVSFHLGNAKIQKHPFKKRAKRVLKLLGVGSE